MLPLEALVNQIDPLLQSEKTRRKKKKKNMGAIEGGLSSPPLFSSPNVPSPSGHLRAISPAKKVP